MNRGDVGLVLGLAGFLLGGFAVFESRSMKKDVDSLVNERRHDEDLVTNVGTRAEELARALKEVTARVNALDPNPRAHDDRLRQIEERLEAVEKRPFSTGPAPGANDPETQPKAAAPKSLTRGEIRDLREKLAKGTATDAEKAKLDEAMSSLEGVLKETPRDVQAHLELADLYIQKLMTVPDGIERGRWSMKAVGEWNKVLEIEPDNWDAHSALGANYSFWPEQYNKRPDAIKEFETARRIQERSAPDPKYSNTYLQLHLLYKKDGKLEEAKSVLEEGLRRFPNDEELKKAK
jgi:tetratricopeptide (TPR) repeat protein